MSSLVFLFSIFGGSVWVFVSEKGESWMHCLCILLWMCFLTLLIMLSNVRHATEKWSKAKHFFFSLEAVCSCYSGREKKCFCSGGNYISVYSKLEALLRLGALYLFSGELYRNKFTLIFHYPYEPSEISNWLIMLNQNELSYATGLFAAL